MSEVITLTTGQTETIHGTFAAWTSYVTMQYGSTYTAALALSADNQKKCLASAVRYFNAQTWGEDADTFAERDAITAFASAQYEMAVLIAADPTVVSQLDTGSNIASVGAGGASVSYFAPTTGEYELPAVVQRLVGSYLGSRTTASSITCISSTGSSSNPFNDDNDYDRTEPL